MRVYVFFLLQSLLISISNCFATQDMWWKVAVERRPELIVAHSYTEEDLQQARYYGFLFCKNITVNTRVGLGSQLLCLSQASASQTIAITMQRLRLCYNFTTTSSLYLESRIYSGLSFFQLVGYRSAYQWLYGYIETEASTRDAETQERWLQKMQSVALRLAASVGLGEQFNLWISVSEKRYLPHYSALHTAVLKKLSLAQSKKNYELWLNTKLSTCVYESVPPLFDSYETMLRQQLNHDMVISIGNIGESNAGFQSSEQALRFELIWPLCLTWGMCNSVCAQTNLAELGTGNSPAYMILNAQWYLNFSSRIGFQVDLYAKKDIKNITPQNHAMVQLRGNYNL